MTRTLRLGEPVLPDAYLRFACPKCNEAFAAFAGELAGAIKCARCGHVFGAIHGGKWDSA
jgi:ribosomal protein S27E